MRILCIEYRCIVKYNNYIYILDAMRKRDRKGWSHLKHDNFNRILGPVTCIGHRIR